jgi:anti-repressor protein
MLVITDAVRVVTGDRGEPWLVAADVCAALGIQNPTQAMGRLDADERAMFKVGPQGASNTITQSGLYSLILGSDEEGRDSIPTLGAVPPGRR